MCLILSLNKAAKILGHGRSVRTDRIHEVCRCGVTLTSGASVQFGAARSVRCRNSRKNRERASYAWNGIVVRRVEDHECDFDETIGLG
jgi:hypothetical protein